MFRKEFPQKLWKNTFRKDKRQSRLHPQTSQDNEEYKNIYSKRTAWERVNNRFLNDYHLQKMKIRTDTIFLSGLCPFTSVLIGMHGTKLEINNPI